MNRKSPLLQNLLFSALVTSVFFLVTHSVYHLPFSYGDDHPVLAMLHPDKASAAYKTSLFYGHYPDLKGILIMEAHNGRFRPLSWSYDKLRCLLFGDNVAFFRLTNLLALFLSSFFLLSIFSWFTVDGVSSLLVLLVYVFGKNNEIWWTLDPAPHFIGELFLLAGIYCWLHYRKINAKGFYIAPAVLFLLSALSKESFIFCIPILLFTDYLFFNPSPRVFAKEYLLSTLASLLPFLCIVATIAYSKKIYSYPDPAPLFSIIGNNIFQFLCAALFFLAPMVLLLTRGKSINKNTLYKLLLALGIWTAMQLLLLKGIKIENLHHYFIPWLIYPLVLTAIAFRDIRKISGRWYIATGVIYSLAILLFIKNTNVNTRAFSASLKAYYAMIDTIGKDPTSPEIVYLSDDACESDWTRGTRMIMDTKGIMQYLYFATYAKSIPAWEEGYAKNTPQNAFKHMPFDSVFYPDGKWVILVNTPAKNGTIDDSTSFYKRNDSCFFKVGQTVKYIPGTYYYFRASYPERSVGSLFKGNFNIENQAGFYAIKLNRGI